MAVTVKSLVTAIKDDFGYEFGRTKILDYLRRTVNALCNQDVEQMTYFNGSDDSFPFPIISTTTGTLDYAITNANLVDSDGTAITMTVGGNAVVCRKIKHVFITVNSLSNSNYDRKFYGEQFNITGVNQYWSRRLYRTNYYKVPGNIFDRSHIADAHFQFHEDPGTYTDRFFVEFYWGALELTSESIELSLDGDRFEEALIDGTVGLIEKVENGKSDRWDYFERFHKKDFVRYMNASMEERQPLQMPVRPCG